MTAHNLFAMADTLSTTTAEPSADSIASLPVFKTGHASAELCHLHPGQGVPWHRHLHGDDIFYGLQGHALVRVADDGAQIVEHDLTHGALVVVRAGSRHTVVLDSPGASYLLLQAPGDESDFHHEPAPDEHANESQEVGTH